MMLEPQTIEVSRPARPAAPPRGKAARIVGRSAFEAELLHRCGALAADDSPAADGGGFTVMLLRLRRSDRRIRLLATEGADHTLREVLLRVAGVLHEDDLITACSRDEVALFLPKVTQDGVARLAADRIFRALGRMSVGASLRSQLGAAIAPVAGRSI
jgi:GGDEF domain-containing protein